MSILNKIFKKTETHLPNMPAEYRTDYQKFMERKGTPVSMPEDKIPDYGVYGQHQEVHDIPEKKEEPVNMAAFDAFSGFDIPTTPMPQPVQPLQISQPQQISSIPTDQPVTLESLNEKLNNIERILKERGYI